MRDHARVKKLARELAGLPPANEHSKSNLYINPNRPLTLLNPADKIKSSPIDIDTFRTETSIKYPTFTPPSQPPPSLVHAPIARSINSSVLTSRLSKAYTPIPVRHHYHHDEYDGMHTGGSNGGGHGMYPQFQSQQGQQQQGFRPQPATPAPSPPPPPSPKPKKQQYQTDQTRPFLFPFSKSQFGKDPRLVPFAIDEADKLYNKHMYISLALAQMWRTREDCMTAESGLERMPGTEAEFKSSTYNADVGCFSFCAMVNLLTHGG